MNSGGLRSVRTITARRGSTCPGVDDAPDSALLAVTDVQRAVRRLRDAVGPIDRVARVEQRLLAGEALREHFEGTGRLAGGQGLERDVVAGLRLGRAVPGSVEGVDRAVGICGRELRAGVNVMV